MKDSGIPSTICAPGSAAASDKFSAMSISATPWAFQFAA